MDPQGHSLWAAGKASGHVGRGQPGTSRELRREAERRRRREAKQLQQLMQVRMGFTD